jgi:hypothetical protein
MADSLARKVAQQENDLLTAMRAIEHGMHADKGNYFLLRAYLDKHGRYHGNLQEEAVILEVAQVAILVAERSESALAPMREALQALVETYGDYSRAEEFVAAMAKAERLLKGEQ